MSLVEQPQQVSREATLQTDRGLGAVTKAVVGARKELFSRMQVGGPDKRVVG